MCNETDWERIPTETGVYAMRNAQNNEDCQEIKVVLAVVTKGGGLTEINVYDSIGEMEGYYGEYKKLRPFNLSKAETIAKEDLEGFSLEIWKNKNEENGHRYSKLIVSSTLSKPKD